MKRSNRLVILVGVLLAVLAFVGIVILLNQDGGNGPGPDVTTVTVMVALEDIAIGDPVGPESVEARQVNPDAVVNTRIPDPSMLTNRPALIAVAAGQQVTQEMVGLVGGGFNAIADQLEPGEKAIAFQVDRVTGLDFLVQRGDYIDIVISEQLQVLQPTADTANLPRNPGPSYD